MLFAGRRLPPLCLLVLCLLLSASGVAARERLLRKFDLERGLPFSEVYSVKQDSRGFIWVATGGGLFRYDGIEFRPWPREPFRPWTAGLATGPAGEVLFRNYTGTLFEVAGEEVRPIKGPGGAPLQVVAPPVWGPDGSLWVPAGGHLWIRSTGGNWREFPLFRLDSRSPRLLAVAGDGAVIAITDAGIWRMDSSLAASRLVAMEGVQEALVGNDGSIVAIQGNRVVEVKGGAERELFRTDFRPIDLVRRGRTLWVAYDYCLVALTPGEPPEILGLPENVPSGGPLLVDREGALWMGTFQGLLQFPEPDTVAWGRGDGMATNGSRRLALSPEGIWIDSWDGLYLLRRKEGSWRPEHVPGTDTAPLCVGDDGTLWTGYRDRLLQRREGRFTLLSRPGLEMLFDCAAGAEGRTWLASNLGLEVTGDLPGRLLPRPVPGPPETAGKEPLIHLLEDSRRRLWYAAGESICSIDARATAAGGAAAWSCNAAPGTGRILGLAEVSPGHLWAATLMAGVYRLTADGRWEPIPGSGMLPTRLVRKLRPSPSGGAWIISFGTILRVEERPGTGSGWEIVERPSPWHGLMISDAEDLLEEPSGDLWITTLAGVVHIPPEVRHETLSVPPVELVAALVDAVPLPAREKIRLPYQRNRIELRFAGLSFRDPARLRYQVRLRPDAPWVEASGNPSFRFVDLPPGAYQAEVRASLDGTAWSPATARLSFTVAPPFWRTRWFTLLALGAVASLAYALYRYRLGHLLRLERLRTRIAADLHDDIGASLSQIAILNEVALTRLGPEGGETAGMLGAAAESARELVDSMSDVVWAVDPRKDRMEDLVLRMRRFAEELCEAQGIELSFTVPADGARRLDAEIRRQVLLLFKESLNNAIRHSGCRRVSAELAASARDLQLRVADDGSGFDPERAREGQGLASLRRRAEALRGRMTLRSRPGEGTEVIFFLPV